MTDKPHGPLLWLFWHSFRDWYCQSPPLGAAALRKAVRSFGKPFFSFLPTAIIQGRKIPGEALSYEKTGRKKNKGFRGEIRESKSYFDWFSIYCRLPLGGGDSLWDFYTKMWPFWPFFENHKIATCEHPPFYLLKKLNKHCNYWPW